MLVQASDVFPRVMRDLTKYVAAIYLGGVREKTRPIRVRLASLVQQFSTQAFKLFCYRQSHSDKAVRDTVVEWMDDEHHFELTMVFVSLRDQVTQWLASKEGTEVRTMPVKFPNTTTKSDYQLRSMKLVHDVPLEAWVHSAMNSMEMLLNSAWEKVKDVYLEHGWH